MEPINTKLLADIFRELLDARRNANLYKQIFKAQEDGWLDYWYVMYRDDPNPAHWFTSFHESLRTREFFKGLNCFRYADRRTPAQVTRYRELQQLIQQGFMDLKHDEEGASLRIEEHTKEFKELEWLRYTRQGIGIVGILDNILWQLIYEDAGHALEHVMGRTFEQYEVSLKLLIANDAAE